MQYKIIKYMALIDPYLAPFAALGVVILLVITAITHRKQSHKVQTPGQLRTAPDTKAHGIIFGRDSKRKVVYSPVDAEGHVFVVAPSGAGKTSAVLIPTLRSWNSGAFVIDISGDISKHVDVPQKLIFAPGRPDSAPYNVFAAIDALKSENERLEALEGLALLLMPNNPGAADAARFFCTEGRKMLTAALIAFYPVLDFVEICQKFVATSCNDLLLDIQDTGNAAALRYISSFRGQSTSQNTLGCKQAADAAIMLFATNEVIADSIRRPRPGETAFAPEALETHSCFVVIEDTKLELYGPQLLGLCVSQVLQYIARRPLDNTNQIILALDEFAAFGYLDGICGTLERCRKRHTRVIALVQGIPNVRRIYDEQTTMAMLANFRFKLCLGADDIDTQQLIADTVGYADKTKISRTHGKTNSTTISDSREYLIEPSSLGRLGNKLLLIHPDGHMFLDKNFYFAKKKCHSRTR